MTVAFYKAVEFFVQFLSLLNNIFKIFLHLKEDSPVCTVNEPPPPTILPQQAIQTYKAVGDHGQKWF